MTGGSLFRRAKKAICRGGSSIGGSNIGESSRETESITPSITPSTPVHPDSQEEIECSGSQHTSRHSFCGTDPAPEEGMSKEILSGVGGEQHVLIYRICRQEHNSYIDPMLAPIAFPDWRNKGMEPFKKKMLAEVESKFEFPGHIRHWILQSLGVKWRNYKTTLKAEHWDSRPIEEILETVPAGVDQTKELQKILLMRRNKLVLTQWVTQACKLLAEEGLTPKDDNIEANERVFAIVMGPEHSGRVRTQGFGVTPTRFFPQSKTEGGSGSNFGQIASLREEFRSFQDNQKREFGLFRDEMR
ncbi:hypothetical protein IEQ34_011326 [Dendrobium chrysotoxum]|uniref:Uncharacterized protein n=1 Tax=Dendrobium chrysotoxum TaxID=161865 RepID=A0AAV7GYD9_DENCH|nr:hypothetical protein IEQ34_011326 [Dendrobium chrysotoxum]